MAAMTVDIISQVSYLTIERRESCVKAFRLFITKEFQKESLLSFLQLCVMKKGFILLHNRTSEECIDVGRYNECINRQSIH